MANLRYPTPKDGECSQNDTGLLYRIIEVY